jgi:hypothetical protein
VYPLSFGIMRRWVARGGNSLQIWMVVASVLNKQSWTAEKGIGYGANFFP